VRKTFGVLLVLALVLSFSLVATTPVAAEPLEVWVDDDFDDTHPGWNETHFDNIQDGINAVAIGGTVHVAAGTYAETISIPAAKDGLRLLGPNAGKPGYAGDRVAEAQLTGNELRIYASNAVVDGLELSGVSGQYSLAPLADGATVTNNVLEVGMCVWIDVEGLQYTYNLIRNTDPAEVYGSVFHNAIYAEGGGRNWTVTDNRITEVRNAIVMSHVNREYRDIVFSRNEVIEPLVMGVNIGPNTIIGNMTITDNTMMSVGNSGVYFGHTGVRIDAGATIAIRGNEIVEAGAHGVFLAADEVGADAAINISRNIIRNGNIGVRIYTEVVAGVVDSIGHNFIGFNIYGIFIDAGADPSGISAHYNAICCNTIGVDNRAPEPFHATNNWWGSNDGPGGDGPGKGDAVTGNVIYEPWLVLTLTADPPSVAPGGTSVITADATRNSDGDDTGADIPDGTPILFATTSSSVDPELAIAQDGVATTTYTAGEVPGTVSATAPCYPENIEVLDVPVAPVPGVTVGWEGLPINRVGVMAPWLAVLAAMIAGATLVVVRRRAQI